MRERREKQNGMKVALVLVAASVLFFYLFAQQATRSALFVPGPASYEFDEAIREVSVDDGLKLAVFWGPAPGASKTVFYFHGNGEDLGHVRFILENYRLQGVNVLSFDYRGYGLSEGKPSERNTFDDAQAVLSYAVESLGVDKSRLVLHGRSLGGGVAMELAQREAVAGLILESAFLSAYRIYFPLKWMPGDKYRNYKKAPRLACPTLIIHGKRDKVVPFSHGLELAELIPKGLVKTLWVEEAGHNDLARVASSRYWPALRRFLASL